MKRTIRVTIDVELADDAFAPFGATSSDQEHVYFDAACIKVADAVSSAFQTQAARGRYVCSEFLHLSRKAISEKRVRRLDLVDKLRCEFSGPKHNEARDAFVDSLRPCIHREIARSFFDDLCHPSALTPAQSLTIFLTVPTPPSIALVRAIESLSESEVAA